MIKKSKTSDLILPGKSYFLKNPDGFVFTYLFASGASQDAFVTLLKRHIIHTSLGPGRTDEAHPFTGEMYRLDGEIPVRISGYVGIGFTFKLY